MRIRKDSNFLLKFCQENNIELLEKYENKIITRDSIIKTKCSNGNCKNESLKKMRELLNSGSFCFMCTKISANDKRKKTCLEKYGHESCMQNIGIKEKLKKTVIEKYGVNYTWQNEIVKQKIIETNILKYGVKNATQNKDIQDKRKATLQQKYNVEYSGQIPESREKYKITCLNRYGAENSSQVNEFKEKKKTTCLKNYGVEYPSQSDEIKKAQKTKHIEKYGVEFPMQRSEVMAKNKKSCFKKKEYLFPSGRKEMIQGFEHFALNDILNDNVLEADIVVGEDKVPEIWYFDNDGIKHRHYVDIFIPSQNKCIEVKSSWTLKLHKQKVTLKKQEALKLGFNYEIWVYDVKGNKRII
jgi:hypothetical protein